LIQGIFAVKGRQNSYSWNRIEFPIEKIHLWNHLLTKTSKPLAIILFNQIICHVLVGIDPNIFRVKTGTGEFKSKILLDGINETKNDSWKI